LETELAIWFAPRVIMKLELDLVDAAGAQHPISVITLPGTYRHQSKPAIFPQPNILPY